MRAVSEHTARLQRLDQALQERVNTWRLAPVVEALQALRGVQFTVAVTTVAELGDLTRLTNPKQLMRDLGLTPSEYSHGLGRSHGGITKTGNSHARRALVEGVWAYRYPAQVRLCKRYRQLMARGKNATQVVIAIARELVAFMWAIAREITLPA